MITPESKALHGIVVLVTRAPAQARPFVRALRQRGATVIKAAMVVFAPPSSWHDTDSALSRLSDFDWLVFTSANAVRFFLQRLEDRNATAADLRHLRLAVVGTKTAEAAESAGLHVDLVPQQQSASGLLSELAAKGVTGQRFLIPQAEEARGELAEGLCELGAQVVAVPVYRTVAPWHLDPRQRPKIELRAVDAVTFFSPSALRHFLELFSVDEVRSQQASGLRIAAIGPTTQRAVAAAGLSVDVVPPLPSSEALADALVHARYRHRNVTDAPAGVQTDAAATPNDVP